MDRIKKEVIHICFLLGIVSAIVGTCLTSWFWMLWELKYGSLPILFGRNRFQLDIITAPLYFPSMAICFLLFYDNWWEDMTCFLMMMGVILGAILGIFFSLPVGLAILLVFGIVSFFVSVFLGYVTSVAAIDNKGDST